MLISWKTAVEIKTAGGVPMTPNEFRKMALSLLESSEAEHMGHPDFRVGGKVFATLGYPTDEYGCVSLAPQQQTEFVQEEPDAFQPVKGQWGERGATMVKLKSAKKKSAKEALIAAWRNRAPKKLVREYDGGQ
jgi:hypothetical protein